MIREYEMLFGRHPIWSGGSRLTVDELLGLAADRVFERCNCPAYEHTHTWGVAQCFRPSYWCARCGEPCHYTEENGEDHAPDLRNQTILLSDCCRDGVFRDHDLKEAA